MAVYKHEYQRYRGELTARFQRMLVIPRYAYRRVFRSRFFLVFFVVCLIVPMGGALLIYLKHNLSALQLLQIPDDALFPINAVFFKQILVIQGSFAFLLTVFVGPGLVSPDLTNNALPLYLSRPFSRFDYVIGKMSVLILLQSAVTWIPLGLLFFLQGNLAGNNWMIQNARILVATLVGSFIWIFFLSLLGMTVSAWVKWKAVAGAILFGVVIVGAGFGEIVKVMFTTRWGDVFQPTKLIQIVWQWLFVGTVDSTTRVNGVVVGDIPVWSAWLALAIISGVCLLLLGRRIKAYEVVR